MARAQFGKHGRPVEAHPATKFNPEACHDPQLFMKKTLLIAIFALLPFAATNASGKNKAMVNVPFAFIANHQVIPAGHYQILSSDSILMLIDANTGRAQAALLGST